LNAPRNLIIKMLGNSYSLLHANVAAPPWLKYCAIYNPKFTNANSRKTWRELGSAYNKLQLLPTWRLQTRRVQDTCYGYVTHWLQMSILPNQTLIFLKHSDPSFQWHWNVWIPPQLQVYTTAYVLYKVKTRQAIVYNVIFRHVRATIAAVAKRKVLHSGCVFIAAIGIPHELCTHHTVICDLSSSTVFFHIFHKRHYFQEKSYWT
jgi:hypothetical protein